ncbi:predicted protein, partial [Postia placenta Mad-698-R]
WKSTRASSGSTLLTSISLIFGKGSGLSAPLRGVVGVLGLEPEELDPSVFVGVPGTEASLGLGLLTCLVRDSVDRAALNFFAEPRRLGVVDRGMRPVFVRSSLEAEKGRFGVNGTERVNLLELEEEDEVAIAGYIGERRAPR